MTWLLSLGLIFLAVLLALVSLYALMNDLWLRDQARLSERLDSEFRTLAPVPARGPLFKDLARLAAELAAEEGPRPGWRARLELLTGQAGLRLSPELLLLLSGGLGLASGAAAYLCGDTAVIVLAAGLGMAAPWLFVAIRRRRRLEKLRSQLPEAFELMGRVLRSGRSLTQALQGVAVDCPSPIADAFARCYEQQNLGLSPAAAYEDLAQRVGLPEFRMFAVTMLVQQRTGGNVAEPLDKLACMVRERLRIRLKMQTQTSESRLQALVLTVLPPVVFVMLWGLKRGYVESMFRHPWLLAAIGVSQLGGILWVRAIVQDES